MAIERSDLLIFKPEQLGNSDQAGGQRTSNPVVSGQLNNLFPPISDIDHAQSAVQLAKCYPALNTAGVEQLIGAHVFISTPPVDPLVEIIMVESPLLTDESRRTDMVDILESERSLDAIHLTVATDMVAGQASFLHTYAAEMPAITTGTIVAINVEYTGADSTTWPKGTHFCQISAVNLVAGASITQQRTYSIEFTPPLPFDTPGSTVNINGQTGVTKLRLTNTLTANVKFHGVKPLAATVAAESFSLNVGNTRSYIVPTISNQDLISGVYPLSGSPSSPGSFVNKTLTQIASASTVYTFTANDILAYPAGSEGRFGPDFQSVRFTTAAGNSSTNAVITVTGNVMNVELSSQPQAGSVIELSYISSENYRTHDSVAPFPFGYNIIPGQIRSAIQTMQTGGIVYDLYDAGNGVLRRDSDNTHVATVNYSNGQITNTTESTSTGLNGVYPLAGTASESDPSGVLAYKSMVTTATSSTVYTFTASDILEFPEDWVLPTYNQYLFSPSDFYQIRYTRSNGFQSTNATVSISGGVATVILGDVAMVGTPIEFGYISSDNHLTFEHNMSADPGGLVPSLPTDYTIVPGQIKRAGYAIDYSGGPAPFINVGTLFDSGGGIMKGVSAPTHWCTIDYTTGQIYRADADLTTTGQKFYRYAAILRNNSTPAFINSTSFTLATSTPQRSSLVIRATTAGNTAVTGTTDENGVITGAGISGSVSANGAVSLTFTSAIVPQSLNYDVVSVTNVTEGNYSIRYWAMLAELVPPSVSSTQFTLRTSNPRIESLFIRARKLDNTPITASADAAGVITGTGISGTVNAANLVSLTFADPILSNSLNYDIINLSETLPPPELYNVNSLMISGGGRVPLFRKFGVVAIQHSAFQPVVGPAPGQVKTIREGARFVDITDANNMSLWTADNQHFTVDSENGEVTINSNFAGFTAPFVLTDTIGELGMVADITDSTLLLQNSLTREYPAGSTVASVQTLGDLGAVASPVRDMSSWNNNWDEIGTPVSANLNTAAYPIELNNRGTINEDWAIVFTSSTAFNVIGRGVGLVASGDTLNDLAPLNGNLNEPYFIIRSQAFGGGWNAGEAIRFKTFAAAKPIMLVRVVQSGHSQVTTDKAILSFRGNEA